MHLKVARSAVIPAVAIIAVTCQRNGNRVDSTTVARETASVTAETSGLANADGEYALVQMGPHQSLPYEESGYTADCSRVMLGGTFQLTGDAWAQRDSAQYRCGSTPPLDSVETFGGPIRQSGDTLHLDVVRGQQPMEVEIARVAGDTLMTGLGISGSTPRRYVRVLRRPPP